MWHLKNNQYKCQELHISTTMKYRCQSVSHSRKRLLRLNWKSLRDRFSFLPFFNLQWTLINLCTNKFIKFDHIFFLDLLFHFLHFHCHYFLRWNFWKTVQCQDDITKNIMIQNKSWSINCQHFTSENITKGLIEINDSHS